MAGMVIPPLAEDLFLASKTRTNYRHSGMRRQAQAWNP